jgi:stage II sporulation protein D
VSDGRVGRREGRALRGGGGAPVALLALVTAACPRPAPAPALAEEPELRVGLAVGRDSVALGGDGELVLTGDAGRATPVGTIPAASRWWVVPDTGGVRLVRPDSGRTARLGRVVAVNVSEGRFVMVNGRRYRGRVAVYRDAVGVTAVNVVRLEGYVAGVIGQELGPRAPDEAEALLAQAIVSRTYALRNRGRWSALGFDAHADVRDQTYLGVAGETPAVWDAVRRTGGRALRYRGELIEAFFHSTCGYRTASPQEAFRTVGDRPYLRSVSDAAGGGRYYCERSPRFRWREEWEGAELRTILSRTLAPRADFEAGGMPSVRDVAVTRETKSGRVAELRIAFPRGDVRVPGYEVRDVLRRPDRPLWSAAFQLQVTRTGDEVTRLVAAGAGSGHGVGMCQWGAIGRARAGQDHERILATYYPGTRVERVY